MSYHSKASFGQIECSIISLNISSHFIPALPAALGTSSDPMAYDVNKDVVYTGPFPGKC